MNRTERPWAYMGILTGDVPMSIQGVAAESLLKSSHTFIVVDLIDGHTSKYYHL